MTTKIITISNQKGGVGKTTSAVNLVNVLSLKNKQVLLKEDVRAIAREHSLPVREVVWFFIMEGTKAFRNGNFHLQPSLGPLGRLCFRKDVNSLPAFLENLPIFF